MIKTIIICGPNGVGKTTLAKDICSTDNKRFKRMTFDDVERSICSLCGYSNKYEEDRLIDISWNLYLKLINNMLYRSNVTVVLDHQFGQEEVDDLVRICGVGSTMTIRLEDDIRSSFNRAMKRDGHCSQDYSDFMKDNNNESYDDYVEYEFRHYKNYIEDQKVGIFEVGKLLKLDVSKELILDEIMKSIYSVDSR